MLSVLSLSFPIPEEVSKSNRRTNLEYDGGIELENESMRSYRWSGSDTRMWQTATIEWTFRV